MSQRTPRRSVMIAAHTRSQKPNASGPLGTAANAALRNASMSDPPIDASMRNASILCSL